MGRANDPLDFPEPPAGADLKYPSAGNRFDSPTEDSAPATSPPFDPEDAPAAAEDLAKILTVFGYSDLDVATVRGGDRRITRWIAKWAYEQRDDAGPAFAGIRYLSRLSSDWECWAVFEGVGIRETAREPINRQHPALLHVSKTFDLTVH